MISDTAKEQRLAASSARFDQFIDELTCTSREQRRAALDQRIDSMAMRLGRDRMRPKVQTVSTPQEIPQEPARS